MYKEKIQSLKKLASEIFSDYALFPRAELAPKQEGCISISQNGTLSKADRLILSESQKILSETLTEDQDPVNFSEDITETEITDNPEMTSGESDLPAEEFSEVEEDLLPEEPLFGDETSQSAETEETIQDMHDILESHDEGAITDANAIAAIGQDLIQLGLEQVNASDIATQIATEEQGVEFEEETFLESSAKRKIKSAKVMGISYNEDDFYLFSEEEAAEAFTKILNFVKSHPDPFAYSYDDIQEPVDLKSKILYNGGSLTTVADLFSTMGYRTSLYKEGEFDDLEGASDEGEVVIVDLPKNYTELYLKAAKAYAENPSIAKESSIQSSAKRKINSRVGDSFSRGNAQRGDVLKAIADGPTYSIGDEIILLTFVHEIDPGWPAWIGYNKNLGKFISFSALGSKFDFTGKTEDTSSFPRRWTQAMVDSDRFTRNGGLRERQRKAQEAEAAKAAEDGAFLDNPNHADFTNDEFIVDSSAERKSIQSLFVTPSQDEKCLGEYQEIGGKPKKKAKKPVDGAPQSVSDLLKSSFVIRDSQDQRIVSSPYEDEAEANRDVEELNKSEPGRYVVSTLSQDQE